MIGLGESCAFPRHLPPEICYANHLAASHRVWLRSSHRGRSSMAERQLPKLHTRVRFPSPAPDFPMSSPDISSQKRPDAAAAIVHADHASQCHRKEQDRDLADVSVFG